MTRRFAFISSRTIFRAGVVGAASILLFAMSMAPSFAAGDEGDVDVTNTETVQVLMDATADVENKRVYEQTALTGSGAVSFANPISESGLRNLDGFDGFDIKDGKQHVDASVDGYKRFRSVSSHTKDLPVDISVEYFLDGEPVEPGDVVGESGNLEVKYRVENMTGKTQTVTYPDGHGKTTETKEEVVIPMVGQLTTTLPASFTDVASDESNSAGDGRGGTKLSFTMTLFPPIGSSVAEFGYTAKIKDGVIPPANVNALPVNPLKSPSFKGGAASYEGGAESGQELTAGATEIDQNLLRLRDGAQELLAGLIKLRDGSRTLSAGLNNEAVPGAKKIGDGAGKLRDGTGKLNAGASKLADGTGRLNKGANKLADGAGRLEDGLNTAGEKAPALIDGLKQIKDGLQQVDNGLKKMGNKVGKGGKQLSEGITQLKAGIGTKSDDTTLLGGITTLRKAIKNQMIPGLDEALDPEDGIPASQQELECAANILYKLTDASAPKVTCQKPQVNAMVNLSAGQVIGVPAVILGDGLPGQPGMATQLEEAATGEDGLPKLKAGLEKLRAGLRDQALPGLAKISCGLDNMSMKDVCDPKAPGLLQGLKLVDAGVTKLVSGVVEGVGEGDDTAEDGTLRGGVNALQGGNQRIVDGGKALLDGLDKLSAGAGRLDGGAQKIAGGTGKLDAGAGKIADGADRLNEGAGRLEGGIFRLVDGLVAAADGASRIADGLDKAAEGGQKLPEGVQKLSNKGTKKLMEAGNSTATDYGQKYAVIEAGAQRAQTAAMAYGAPDGAVGMTAYQFELDGATGEGSRNTGRGVAALALFAIGGGVAMFRRRVLA